MPWMRLKCDNCGRGLERRRYGKKLTYKHAFCDHKCEAEYRSKQKRVEAKCAYCGTIFPLAINRTKNRKNLYCSRKCMSEGFKNRIVLKCRICGKKFERTVGYVNRYEEIFCFMKCRRIILRKTGTFKTYKQLPFEWGYLLGVLCSDGYLQNLKEKYGYNRSMKLLCKENGFADLFKQILERITNEKCVIKKRLNRDTVMNSIDFRHYALWKAVWTKGKYRCQEWRVPKIVLNGNEQIKIGFLQGFFDGEGCISQQREGRLFPRLSVCSVSYYGLMDVGKLLIGFGIDFYTSTTLPRSEERNHNIVYNLTIGRKGDVIVYSQIIGFGKKEHKEKFDKLTGRYLDKVKFQNIGNQKGKRTVFEGGDCGRLRKG